MSLNNGQDTFSKLASITKLEMSETGRQICGWQCEGPERLRLQMRDISRLAKGYIMSRFQL